MFYARKITEDGWFGKEELYADSISELNVDELGLSVWKIRDASNKINVDMIALALAMISHKIDELYMVLLNPEDIMRQYKWVISFKPQEGNTYYSQLRGEHTNFIVPTFWEIGYLAEYIHKLLEDPSNYYYYDVVSLKLMAYQAAKDGRITKKDISGTQWKTAVKEMEAEQGNIEHFWD